MYTGIITDLGRVRTVDRTGDARFEFSTSYDMNTVAIGASIACDGVCLTVVDTGNNWFAAQVSQETLDRTTVGSWSSGREVNFERSLKVGDEFGGHLVFGHVDGVATLVNSRAENDSRRLVFEAPSALAKFIAVKGSVAVNGVSLTVNEVNGVHFGVNIIAHTQKVTTLGKLSDRARVNLEVDMLARYAARLVEQREET